MVVPAFWSCVHEKATLVAPVATVALFAQGLRDISGDVSMGWNSCGLIAWKWEMKAVPLNHATARTTLHQSSPTGGGSGLWAMKGSGQLGSFQAVTARCQVQKRSCFYYALCSKVTSEPRAGVCEDRKMLFAALSDSYMLKGC